MQARSAWRRCRSEGPVTRSGASTEHVRTPHPMDPDRCDYNSFLKLLRRPSTNTGIFTMDASARIEIQKAISASHFARWWKKMCRFSSHAPPQQGSASYSCLMHRFGTGANYLRAGGVREGKSRSWQLPRLDSDRLNILTEPDSKVQYAVRGLCKAGLQGFKSGSHCLFVPAGLLRLVSAILPTVAYHTRRGAFAPGCPTQCPLPDWSNCSSHSSIGRRQMPIEPGKMFFSFCFLSVIEQLKGSVSLATVTFSPPWGLALPTLLLSVLLAASALAPGCGNR